MKNLFESVTTLIFLFAAIILSLMALLIMGWSVYEVVVHTLVAETLSGNQFIPVMLQSVGAVIIAVAILDVAKYMVEEEVFRKKELRTPREVRDTLSKIMVIVAIAVSIEALVYIFKAGAEDLRLLVYPALLIVAAVLLVLGLGVFLRLSVGAEIKQDDKSA